MTLCTDQVLVNENPNGGRVASLKCKRWTCEHCAAWCRRQVVKRARDGNPTTFMTLTWNARRAETPDEAARVMKTAFVNLRRRIKREFKTDNIPFIVVFERTKAGMPHMHILMRAPFIPQKWLSEVMRELIDAPIVDIRAIKDRKHAFWYITKYLGKDLAAFDHCKRWWRSHNYEIEKDEPYKPFLFGDRVVIERTPFHDVLFLYSNRNYDITMEGRDAFSWQRRWGLQWHSKHFGSSAPRTSPGTSACCRCRDCAK